MYIKSIENGLVNFEIEILTEANRYNEYMMTSLRRMEGFDLDLIAEKFGEHYQKHSIAMIKEMDSKNIFNQNTSNIQI